MNQGLSGSENSRFQHCKWVAALEKHFLKHLNSQDNPQITCSVGVYIFSRL